MNSADPRPASAGFEHGRLPEIVVARIEAELGASGKRAVNALRTAAHLIALAREDDSGLRLAESAAYNLREAFDAVVEGKPAGEGGFPAVQAAWLRYQLALVAPDAEEPVASREFHAVVERLCADDERQAFMTRKLIGYLVDQTGVAPLPGVNDPTRQYSRLREQAATTLHADEVVPVVAALHDDAIAWFVRLFTPPDDRVTKIAVLAAAPYEDTSQIEALAEMAFNAHHVALFLSEINDPRWLDALYDAGLITLPVDGEPWPVNFVLGGAGNIDPASVARLLQRMISDNAGSPTDRRLSVARDVIQTASRLGAAGRELAAGIVTAHPADHWVQGIALNIARSAPPTDEIVQVVADAVIGNEHPTHGGYYTRTILEQLARGITAENARARVTMIAAKIRRLSGQKDMRFVPLDIAALGTPGDDLRHPVLTLAQHLAQMIPTWRTLGLPTADLVAMVQGVTGELGDRLVCQVLAGAQDADRNAKVEHLAQRMTSPTATGDDRDLLADVGDLSDDEVAVLVEALGEPSPAPDPPSDEFPDDWARAWRWSLLLPAAVLEGWANEIAAVTAKHGTPNISSLDTRVPLFLSGRPESPLTVEQLTAVAPLQAAELVAGWRPNETQSWWGNSVWELASALESAVKDGVAGWTADPTAIVVALREPVYIERYLRALATIKESAATMPALLAAVRHLRQHRWTPSKLSHSRADPDLGWEAVDRTIVEMIGALANQEGDLSVEGDLDLAWELAIELARQLPDDLGEVSDFDGTSQHDGPLNRAINHSYSKALETAIRLAWWEHRNLGQARPALADVLDEALEVTGAVGAEMRAIIATNRRVLEHIARDWMNRRVDDLFGGDLGPITFEQTLAWDRPTPWFLGRFRARLAAAALRGAEHAASWMLVGYLWEEPEYSVKNIIASLRSDIDALKTAAEEMASLVQDREPGDPLIARALTFWDGLLHADRGAVPAAALTGAGRWTFVPGLSLADWFDRMERTLQVTRGAIDFAMEVADRCKQGTPSNQALRMLRLMQGQGEPWQRSHVAGCAAEALRATSGRGVGSEFNRLRDRLLELGRLEVKDIPAEPASDS